LPKDAERDPVFRDPTELREKNLISIVARFL